MKKIFISVAALLLLSFASYAQQGVYNQMVAKLKGGDTGIDFKALRTAYTDTKAFGPYTGDAHDMAVLYGDKKYDEAVKMANEHLDKMYIDIDAHVIATVSYEALKNTEKAKFHRAVAQGLLDSIMKEADGKSTASAYPVISIAEENSVLRTLGLRKTGQSLVTEGAHRFDVIGVTDPKTNTQGKVYFNIDLLWKGYEKMFSK